MVPPTGTFALDRAHTFVGFSAQHLVVGRVRGRFEVVQGTINIADDPSASAVEATIETASLTTLNRARDGDLRSARYLDVEQYPTMTFSSTATRELPAGAWLVVGDLSLHGVTRPVELTVHFGGAVNDANGIGIAFHAQATITRHDFGLTYELLNEAGDLLVRRDVAIDIDAEARKNCDSHGPPGRAGSDPPLTRQSRGRPGRSNEV
jgi:polyisoprenoid-binding protein YceI